MSTIRFLLISIVSGLAIGMLTLAGQANLPDSLGRLVNSGAIWVIVAFVLGCFAPKWQTAAIAGLLALVGEVIGYYFLAWLVLGDYSPSAYLVIGVWLLAAFVAGPLLGAAGYVSQHSQGIKQKIAAGALGGVFIGEGLYLGIVLGEWSSAVGYILLALLITFFVTRRQEQRAVAFLVTAGIGGVFLVGMFLLNWLMEFRAGPG